MSMEMIKWKKRKLGGVVNIYKLFLVWSVVHTWPTFVNTFTSTININIMYFAKCIFFQLTYTICGFFIRWFQLNLYVCIRYICNKYNDEWPVKTSCNIINSFSWSTLPIDRFSIITTLALLVITASSTCWFQTTSEWAIVKTSDCVFSLQMITLYFYKKESISVISYSNSHS